MKVSEIRLLLAALAQQARDEGEIDALDKLLTKIDERSVSELVAAISASVEKLAKKKAPSPKKTTPVNEVGVARYVDELSRSRHDSATFEVIVRRMEKDKNIRLPEAKEIAARFNGEQASYKTKKDAIKAVLQRQITDKRAAVRGSQVNDLF